jgi:anti-sigma-K factor RskA
MTTSTDQTLIELLPWYINNTVDAQQRADIDALLSRSEDARQQLAELQALATAVKNQEQQLNNELANSNELGWARLQKTIRQENNKSNASKAATRDWWRPSLAAAAAVILALQLTIIYRDSLPPSGATIDWQTLGADRSTQQQTISGGYRVQIRFVGTATWETIQDVLQSLNARLIDGPSTLGIVQIYVPDNNKLFSGDKELLQVLQQKSVIQHAAIVGKIQR